MHSDTPLNRNKRIKARVARRQKAQQVMSLIEAAAGAGRLSVCDIDLLKRMAQQLGDRNAPCEPSREEARLIERFRQLSELQQDGIIILMEAFAPADSEKANPSKGDV